MKFLNLFVASLLALATVASAEEKCCTKCTKKGEEKYYSIDLKHDMCGECCMKPILYPVYHLFEKGLLKAENEHPCHELGYTKYVSTETHGALFIKQTLDKYDHEDLE
eukprot:jgi/Orpsp1_1/1192089/evm.model.d7180000090535.1